MIKELDVKFNFHDVMLKTVLYPRIPIYYELRIDGNWLKDSFTISELRNRLKQTFYSPVMKKVYKNKYYMNNTYHIKRDDVYYLIRHNELMESVDSFRDDFMSFLNEINEFHYKNEIIKKDMNESFSWYHEPQCNRFSDDDYHFKCNLCTIHPGIIYNCDTRWKGDNFSDTFDYFTKHTIIDVIHMKCMYCSIYPYNYYRDGHHGDIHEFDGIELPLEDCLINEIKSFIIKYGLQKLFPTISKKEFDKKFDPNKASALGYVYYKYMQDMSIA